MSVIVSPVNQVVVIDDTNIEVISAGVQGPTGAPGQGVPTGGTTGQALTKIDSTNYNTHWSTVTTSPAGSDGQIQFNLSGAFGASANLTWDNTNKALAVSGSILTQCNGSSIVPLTAKGVASQSANLTEWISADYGTVAYVDGFGNLKGRQLLLGGNGDTITPYGVGSQMEISSRAGLLVDSSGIASAVPLTAKGAALQSANLQEWWDNSANVLASINSAGHLMSAGLEGANQYYRIFDGTTGVSVRNDCRIGWSSSPADTEQDVYFTRNSTKIVANLDGFVGFAIDGDNGGICLAGSDPRYAIKFSSGLSALSPLDVGLGRDSAGVVRVTDASTGYGNLIANKLSILPTGTAAGNNPSWYVDASNDSRGEVFMEGLSGLRFYFGSAANPLYSINFQHVSNLEGLPGLTFSMSGTPMINNGGAAVLQRTDPGAHLDIGGGAFWQSMRMYTNATLAVSIDASQNTTFSGGVSPAHMADTSAANDTIYFSTDATKLVYKDSGGTVHNLY